MIAGQQIVLRAPTYRGLAKTMADPSGPSSHHGHIHPEKRMRQDSKLSDILHILLHMGQKDTPQTSEALAKMLNTNPVVVRRLMAGLREQGYVRSEKGHGGGWTLACDPSTVTLRDIYLALGSPTLLAIGNRAEAHGCLVEEAVNSALRKSFEQAETLLLARFAEVTLAMLGDDVRDRMVARGQSCDLDEGHAHTHHD